MYRIPFNKPFIIGKELDYMAQAVALGNLAGDGHFTRKCTDFLEQHARSPRVLLTPSCTASLELAAQLCDLGPGDEVIVPSYTFVSTASSFARLGARPVFVDVRPDTLNLDERLVEAAVGDRTRAIFVVHYGGVACEMETICEVAARHGLRVVEDAAQGVACRWRGRPLGGIGDLGAFSFHETKNYICGEGGALCINDESLVERAEILRDKGTNRQAFRRGETDRYTWTDLGSSWVQNELSSAFLYAQLEQMEAITNRRREIHERYARAFAPLEADGRLGLPHVPDDCRANYHMFYLLLPDAAAREALTRHLAERGVLAVFHYVPLHLSPMGRRYGYAPGDLPVTEDLAGRLLRLPFYYELDEAAQAEVVAGVLSFFGEA
jgi:dTDP-4-amino-4,6-dideoxygalactose transaminase